MMKILPLPLTIVLCVCLGACSGPQSTKYTAADMDLAVDDIRESLASSGFLAGRDAASPSAVLMPTRMQNLSNERISRVDQWAAVSRVFLDQSVIDLLRSKNISVVLPTAGQRIANAYTQTGFDRGDQSWYVDAEPAAKPTHAVDAVFSSITRAADEDGDEDLADIRKDLYRMDFTIADVASREIVWAGSFELARVARGTLAN